MDTALLDTKTLAWLKRVVDDFQQEERTLRLWLKNEFVEKSKKKFEQPLILDFAEWPKRANVTLLSKSSLSVNKALTSSQKNASTVIYLTLLLVDELLEWPQLSQDCRPTKDDMAQLKTVPVRTPPSSEDENSDADVDANASPVASDADMDVDDEELPEADFSDPEMMEDEEENEEHFCADLQADFKNYEELFGEGRITAKYSIGRNATDLTFFFDTADYISQATADAWGVHHDKPIAVCIRISATRYRDSSPPNVEIWQPGAMTSEDEIATEIKMQEEIQEKGRQKELELRTLHYPNGVPQSELPVLMDMVAKSVPGYSTGPIAPPKPRPYNAGKFGLQVQLINIMNQFLKKHWSPTSRLTDSIGSSLSTLDEINVKKLMDMGYARALAIRAWNASKEENPNGDLHIAANLLTDPDFTTNRFKTKNHSSSSQGKNKKKKKKKKKIKAEVDWSSGFLVAFGSYFVQRFATVNEYCVICDLVHIGVGAALLKPCVCTRDLCCWSFQQLGVGSEATSEIATPVDVTDLLVSMVIAAAKSNRKDQILEPFPTLFDLTNPSHPVLSPEKKDWTLLTTVVNAICSVDSKLAGAWRHGLQNAHKLAWPLLNWITSSNRSHLVRLPPTYFINSMGTPYQYLLISAPPEKEAAFQKAKAKYGAEWAFHGSGPENWHSILRRGLINASGTALQLNGAAYGAGIYLSPNAQVSFGYSRMGHYGNGTTGPTVDPVTGLPDPLRPQETNHCIAICEVVKDSMTKSGDIWVQKNPENVVTRMFFVYPKGQATNSAMSNHTSNQKFRDEIENAAKFYVMQTDADDDEYEDD